MSDYLIRRGLFWTFFRRVPAEYTHVDRRGIVAKSTKIRVADDPDRHRARRIAEKLNSALEAYWRDLAAGEAVGARQRFREATARARRHGFDYVTVHELTSGPLADALRRIEVLEARGVTTAAPTPDTRLTSAALLGTAQEARVTVSGLFDEYKTHQRVEMAKMARERLRMWTNSRQKAAENFLIVLGADKPITALTRTDANAFRRWWGDRVLDEGLKAVSANAQMGLLAVMLERVADAHNLDVPPIFHKLNFKGDSEPGVPFTVEFLRDRLLAPGVLDDLVPEARRIMYIMMETGMRPSEICGLAAASIKLDADIPHVELIPNEHRSLKTKKARRLMPLVGVALKAMQAQPRGFPKYAGKAAVLSAKVNQHLRAAGLMPTEEHTLYSLRHSFKDRLRGIEMPSELMDELMGHSNGRPDYGAGHSLEQKRKWLQRIALPVPATV